MATLFEQYEEATGNSSLPLKTSSVISSNRHKNEPMFGKRRINFRPTSPVVSVVVCNNHLVMALANKTLLKLDIMNPEQQDEIDLSKYAEHKAKIQNLFLDFTGHHLLIGIVGADGEMPVDVIYLNWNSKKPKSASKIKGHNISAIAWDARAADETATGAVLVGTKKGMIFETSLRSYEDRYHAISNVEHYWKQLFDLSQDGPTSITGLEYHLVSGSDNKCFVLVTTPTRLYQFVGQIPSFKDPPLFQNVFNNYPDLSTRFQEIPSHLPYSELQCFFPCAWALPNAFAWMTGAGILHGGLDYSGQAGPDMVTTDLKLIAYPKENDSSEAVESGLAPISIVLTKFHILILYIDRVKALCVLNEEVVIEDIFTETYGNMVRLVKDPISGVIWACSEYAVYKYQVVREDRHVWQVYLNRKEYDLAKQYCKDDADSLDTVISQQAQDYFEHKLYKESANHFAMSRTSFEEVSLKFLQVNKKDALKTYLLQKLASFKPQDKIQVTMLVTWLVELYLNQLGELRDGRKVTSEEEVALRDEFYNFLEMPKVKECISNNRHVVYDLLSSHGDQQSLVHFGGVIQDYERMIRLHIQNGNFRNALDVLQTQNKVDYYYQFCPILMQHIPKETVDACIALARRVDLLRLIPTLVHYNNDCSRYQVGQKNEAIRYLEFCVRTLDCKEQTIHNYLLSLYAKLSPDKLVPYLASQGQDYASVCYDLEYALRVCSECGHRAACVHIFSTMGLYEEAVDLALTFDVDLAKRCVDRPEENEELRKKLWLKIAHHVVREENDIQKVMEFLQECDLVKIEDILPFFPNFVTIDHFKDAICQSLQEYNQHIEGLKEDMEEATQSTNEIRTEIQMFRNKCMSVTSTDKCSSCSYPVLTRSFYLFPCHHTFHTECLISEVFCHLSSSKRNRVEDIQRILASYGGREEVVPLSGTAVNQSSNLPALTLRERIKMELDDIVANECPYCGELIIKSIDEPFIEEDELQEVMQSWE